MIAALIWTLVTLDTGFVGFRVATGRSGRIDKRAHYRRGVARGLVAGQIAVAIAAAAIAVAVASSTDPTSAWESHLAAGRDLAAVYGPYAAAVLASLAIYAIPNPDISSLATVLVLGPFTAIRPLVIVAGAAWTIANRGPGVETGSVVIACGLVVALEPVLSGRWRGIDGPCRQSAFR